MHSVISAKKALRKQTAAALGSLQPAAVASQSAAVLAQLAAVKAFSCASSACIYLPMDGAAEVDTWPILQTLLSRGVQVAIPRVDGPNSADMRVLRVADYETAASLPRTKWGIPEPDDALAAAMEDMTGTPFDLLLVPGVAFDARCNRLGHGRGYYDCFVSRQRALHREAPLSVIGLALAPQLVDRVPVSDTDERLDMVVTPEHRLAFASADDMREAARLAAEGVQEDAGAVAGRPNKRAAEAADDQSSDQDAEQVEAPPVSLEQRVDLRPGVYKYVCLRITPWGAAPFLAVRSAEGSYHADVAEPAIAQFQAKGFRIEPLGGGRIKFDPEARTVHIYGFSVGLGGDEGGPPGRGMPDHAEAAALVRRRLPDHLVTFSADGY